MSWQCEDFRCVSIEISSAFSFYLRARETSTVRLTVLVPQGTAAGTTDRITFNSYGTDTSTFAVNLRVISSIDAQVSSTMLLPLLAANYSLLFLGHNWPNAVVGVWQPLRICNQ